VQVYKKALSLRPNSVPAHIGLAADYAKLGKTQDEVRELELAVKAAPTSAIAHGHLDLRCGGQVNFKTLYEKEVLPHLCACSREHWVAFYWLGSDVCFLRCHSSNYFRQLGFQTARRRTLLKSFFLTFYKDKPGRFVITSRRLVFVPELISSIAHATRVSIERDNVESIESQRTTTGASLIVHTVMEALSFLECFVGAATIMKELEKEHRQKELVEICNDEEI